jgi:hypothetical protein
MQAAVGIQERHRIPAPLVTAVLTVAAFAAHIGVREFTALEPGAPVRLAVTAALVAAFAAHVYTTARAMRSFDEFHRAVHVTAVTVAFPISMVALFAIGFFRAEGLLGEMDPRDLVGLMVIAYGGALAWAWRRYES